MKKRTWFWALPIAGGLALIATAIFLSSASPGGRMVPSAQALGNNLCDLQIHKTGDFNGDEADFTITVRSDDATDDLGCEGVGVVDFLEPGLHCEHAYVEESAGLKWNIDCGKGFDLESAPVDGQEGEEVLFEGVGTLHNDDEVVLSLVARTDREFDDRCVDNRACVGLVAFGAGAVIQTDSVVKEGNCDEVTACKPRRESNTPTPTVTNTPVPPTPTATVYVPPPPLPTAKPLATITAPPTGSGANGGSPWLALGLGLGGVCLLVVSGAALARKRIR